MSFSAAADATDVRQRGRRRPRLEAIERRLAPPAEMVEIEAHPMPELAGASPFHDRFAAATVAP